MKKYCTKLTSHSVSIYPCERISISPDVTIVAYCDKCVCVVWYARLFGVLTENALCAHDITYAGHYEKSLLRVYDSRCCLRKMKIISSDWIALLRRLLIIYNDSFVYNYARCLQLCLLYFQTIILVAHLFWIIEYFFYWYNLVVCPAGAPIPI